MNLPKLIEILLDGEESFEDLMEGMRKIHQVGNHKVYHNRDWDEYVVKPHGSGEESWYYTNDKDDAINTAHAMHKEAQAKQ